MSNKSQVPNLEALRKLVELLNGVHAANPKSFDLGSWVGTDGDDSKLNDILKQYAADTDFDPRPTLTECGTTACACGYAALDPWFRAQGFGINSDRQLVYRHPERLTQLGWDAVYTFFNLSRSVANYLFSSECYRDDWNTADAVADRIQDLIDDYTPQEPENDD